MKLYLAGIYAGNFGVGGKVFASLSPPAQLLRKEVQYYLESYHYIHKGSTVEKLRRDGVKVFLDSGAFSAFSLGVKVSIEAYAEFVKEHQDILIKEGGSLMASVLDAIGDPIGTYHNQNTLERLGAQVLPCFHYGEPWDLAEYYVRNYKYITIGGMVPIPNNKLELWLDELWDRVLTDRDGYSRTKVHGFGLTARKLMKKYPWYSCDSSSWVQTAANGAIVLPEFNTSVFISSRSPNRKKFGQHFNSFPPEIRLRIASALASYGLTIEAVREDYKPRWAINAFTFDRLGRNLGEDHWRKPFRAAQPVLF